MTGRAGQGFHCFCLGAQDDGIITQRILETGEQ